MHLTKSDWKALLDDLSTVLGRPVPELHTAEFYAGKGFWRGLDGPKRSTLISAIFDWLEDRKHKIVFSAIHRDEFKKATSARSLPPEVGSMWRFLGLHLILAVQKKHMGESGTKGHTVFVFDSKKWDEAKLTELVRAPPSWTDSYYSRNPKIERLNCVVDVPYFSDSASVPLIQLADFLAFFLRRYIEMKDALVPAKYDGEDLKLDDWGKRISRLSIGSAHMYPKSKRCPCADIFFGIAPKAATAL